MSTDIASRSMMMEQNEYANKRPGIGVQMGGDSNYISHRIPTREQQKRDTMDKTGATSLMV